MIKAKRILSMLLVMLMLVGANIPAFAATKPTATYLTRESTHVVKRGKTAKLVYNLKCGSYSKKNNVWRSKLFIKIYKDSK